MLAPIIRQRVRIIVGTVLTLALQTSHYLLVDNRLTLKTAPTDTVRLFFTRTEICDAEARVLQVTALQLSLNIRESIKGSSDFFRLGQNFPHPFNPSTTIMYELVRPARVRLAIFDIAGREVRTLVYQLQTEGQYAVKWSAEHVGGSRLPSGAYIARLQVDDQVAIKKMLFVCCSKNP